MAAAVRPPTANLAGAVEEAAPVDPAVGVVVVEVEQFLIELGGSFSFHSFRTLRILRRVGKLLSNARRSRKVRAMNDPALSERLKAGN